MRLLVASERLHGQAGIATAERVHVVHVHCGCGWCWSRPVARGLRWPPGREDGEGAARTDTTVILLGGGDKRRGRRDVTVFFPTKPLEGGYLASLAYAKGVTEGSAG
jgi:hypothetical protein